MNATRLFHQLASRGLVAGVLVAGSGCVAPAGDGAEESTAAVTTPSHIAPGVEIAAQLAMPWGATDLQLQEGSVHFGNAYWLWQLSQLSYQPTSVILSQLASWGFDANDTVFFANTCSNAFAYYVPANGYGIMVFRGTVADSLEDWGTDFLSPRVPWEGAGLVHQGFNDRFQSVWTANPACGIPEGVASFLAGRHGGNPATNPNGAVYLTGHSLGAALATLALAYSQADVCGASVACGAPPNFNAYALYTYGSPKVGEQVFAEATGEGARFVVPVFRFVQNADIVTDMPTDLDPLESLYSNYRHVGDSGDVENILEVWVQNQVVEIGEDGALFHWNPADHLDYSAPLLYQAKTHNQLH